MATYKEIQSYVRHKNGFTPKTCWIADAKERCGMPVKEAWNRQGDKRINPCPADKIEDIKDAFKHFDMI